MKAHNGGPLWALSQQKIRFGFELVNQKLIEMKILKMSHLTYLVIFHLKVIVCQNVNLPHTYGDALPSPGLNPLEGPTMLSCEKLGLGRRSRLPALERGRGAC